MSKHIKLVLLILAALLTITACGNNGGNSSSSSALPLNIGEGIYTKATVKISLSGALPAGSSISGLSFTLFYPSFLTPDMSNGTAAAGVVAPSGVISNGSQLDPVITPPATAASYGKILVTMADMSQSGLTQVGEVAQITLRIANGITPTKNSFILSTNGVFDLNGNTLPAMNAVVSDISLQ